MHPFGLGGVAFVFVARTTTAARLLASPLKPEYAEKSFRNGHNALRTVGYLLRFENYIVEHF